LGTLTVTLVTLRDAAVTLPARTKTMKNRPLVTLVTLVTLFPATLRRTGYPFDPREKA
jgi:hypothetical protein